MNDCLRRCVMYTNCMYDMNILVCFSFKINIKREKKLLCENGDCIDFGGHIGYSERNMKGIEGTSYRDVFSIHIAANVPMLKLCNPKSAVLMCKRRPF